MTVNGVGSWSSPIVISDSDDSEAFVELELERRISSPRDGMDIDYEDYPDSYDWPQIREQEYPYDEVPRWDDHGFQGPPDPPFQECGRKPPLSQKRKRSESPSPTNERPASFAPPSVKARPSSPNAPFGESKSARKKRKKREKLVATGSKPQPLAGPSSVVPPPQLTPLHAPPVYAPLPQIPFMPFGLPHALPQKPAFPLFAMEAASMMLAHQMMPPMAPMPPMPPHQFEPMDGLATPVLTYPSTEEIEEGFIGSFASEIPKPKPVVKKPIGMAPDADPASRHGTYKSPNAKFAPPNPARTLVMELLPKKFRNLAFVRSWAARFTRREGTPRVDLDIKIGKALIEFPTADMARTAWDSDRMLGEGKEHIRVWWYRVPGIGADAGVGVLEEGEVEDGELAKGAGKQQKQKKKVKEEPPLLVIPPSPSTTLRPPSGRSPVAPSKLSSPMQRRLSIPPGFASLPPKPLARRTGNHDLHPPRVRQESMHQQEPSGPTASASESSSRSFPAFLAHTLHNESHAPILVSNSPTPSLATVSDVATEGSQRSVGGSTMTLSVVRSDLELTVALASADQDLNPAVARTANFNSTTTTSSRVRSASLVLPAAPVTKDSSLTALPSAQSPYKSVQPLPIPPAASDDPVSTSLPLSSRSSLEQLEDMPPYRTAQEKKQELAARMARAKQEIEARASSSSSSSRNITPVSEVELSIGNGQVAVCTETRFVQQVAPPKVPTPSDPVSQEHELRREVLKSMKNKVASKPERFSPGPTKMSLDDLATNFIVDTIQAAVVTEFTMPTMSPATMAVSSRIFVGQRHVCHERPLTPIRDVQTYNLLKGEILNRTLNRQRHLFSQLETAQKAERKAILNQLHEVNRLHNKELEDLDKRLAMGKRMQRIWPSSNREDYIIDISDDESEPEDHADDMMV